MEREMKYKRRQQNGTGTTKAGSFIEFAPVHEMNMSFDSFEMSLFHEGDGNGLPLIFTEVNHPNQEGDNNGDVAPHVDNAGDAMDISPRMTSLSGDVPFDYYEDSTSVGSVVCEATSSMDGRLDSLASDEERMDAEHPLTAGFSAGGMPSTSPQALLRYLFKYCARSSSKIKRLADHIMITRGYSIRSIIFFSAKRSTEVHKLKGAVLDAIHYEAVAGRLAGAKDSTSLRGVDEAGNEFQLRGVKALGMYMTKEEYDRFVDEVEEKKRPEPIGYDSEWKQKDLTLRLSSKLRIGVGGVNVAVNHDGEIEFAHA